jgi:hypothetical protein
MTPEIRTRLQNFGVDELKQECLARGSPTYTRVAALALDQKDLERPLPLDEFACERPRCVRNIGKTEYFSPLTSASTRNDSVS